MGETSNIAWTGATWNPWHGCRKVSPGCKNCYMFDEKKRYGQNPQNVVRSKTTFNDPLKWVKQADGPRLVFTCSWSDFFLAEADGWRDEAWQIIRQTPSITYQVLTKRSERIADHLPADWGQGYPNVHLGVSVEGPAYEGRIIDLLAVPARVRWISAEPLLDRLDITRHLYVHMCADCGHVCQHYQMPRNERGWSVCPRCKSASCTDLESQRYDVGDVHLRGLDWVVVGGESGSEARGFDLLHAKELMRQCLDAGVPVFVKQLGARPQVTYAVAGQGIRTDRLEYKDPKGADPAEWPEVMRVRQFPEVPPATGAKS